MTKKSFFLFVMQFAFTMAITYATVSLVNHFFLKKDDNVAHVAPQRGQSFMAPQERQVSKPINREIDFIDGKRHAKEVVTTIATQWGNAVFSTDGASIQRFEVNRELDGKASSITTIFPAAPNERESRCFLVALDRPSPYFYQLVNKSETDQAATLTYEASFDHGSIQKKFVVYKDKYQIDVALAVDVYENPVQIRMLFPAPVMIDLQSQDTISGFALEKGKVVKFEQKYVPMDKGWRKPTLFGASDRYFVNALIADDSDIIDSAYFWQMHGNKLLCCLESSEIVNKSKWIWSFYFGPKDIDDVRIVDSRLEELVEYSGWLGPISVAMLKLLKYLYGYFHNFGVAIIILTLLMRLMMVPLTFSGEKQRKQRTELDKKLKYLQQKYKDNPQKLQQERVELVRKHGFGGMGCIMPLLQIPFFIGLNRLLSTSIELYKAPFIPGWISDLSAPDPYYILPMLFACGMVLTAFQMDKNQRSTFIIMGVGGAVLFSNFASGLVLFFVVSMFSGIVITHITKKLRWA